MCGVCVGGSVGVEILGRISPGLRGFGSPFAGVPLRLLPKLLVNSVTIALVGYMESMTIATTGSGGVATLLLSPALLLRGLCVCGGGGGREELGGLGWEPVTMIVEVAAHCGARLCGYGLCVCG